MCEPKTWQAWILGLACACEPGPAPPPSAPATVVPVASATGAPLSVEPAPPPSASAEEAHADAPKDATEDATADATSPFDRGRAAAGLGAVDLRPCASINGQRGPGRVRITFHASDGRAQAVVLDPPYAGTTIGSCIVERYRRVTVPPFAGADVTVGKSFVIQ